MYPAPPGAQSFLPPLCPPSLPPHPQQLPRAAQAAQDSGTGVSGAPCQALSSAQHHWHSIASTKREAQGPGAPCHARGAAQGGREQSLVLCTHSRAPCSERELTPAARPDGAPCPLLVCEHRPAPGAPHARTPCTARPRTRGPLAPCQHSTGDPEGSGCLAPARPVPCCPRAPALLTVKMLERRLDCLRMGVGVLEAAMVSMRSSRWLMLGVEGTDDE